MDTLAAPLDFSNWTARCHALGKLCSETKEKSNKDKFVDAVKKREELLKKEGEKVEALKKKIEDTKNKETKTYANDCERLAKLKANLKANLQKLDNLISELEPIKDDVTLSSSAIKYLVKVYYEERTGRRYDIKSRYIQKGLEVEDTSIEVVSELDDNFYEKNTKRIFGDYIQGECDIDNEIEDLIEDIKSSYDLESHFLKTIKEMSKDYEWQAQGYMILYNRSNYRLSHVLVSTPKGIVDDEKKRLLWTLGTDMQDSRVYKEGCEEIDFNSYFDDIPASERVFRIQFKKRDDAEETIKKYVIAARKWLNEYAKEMFNLAYNKKGIKVYEEDCVEESDFSNQPSEKIISEIVVEKVVEVISEAIEATSVNVSEEEEEFEEEKFEEYYFGEKASIEDKKENSDEVSEKKEDEQSEKEEFEDEETFEDNEHEKNNEDLEYSDDNYEPSIAEEVVAEAKKAEQKLNDEEEFELIKRIKSCQSESDCLKLYPEIKPKFDKFPNLKILLTEKKKSFKTVEEKPKEEPKKEAAPKTEVKHTENNESKKAETPKDNSKSSDELKALKMKIDQCKTATEIRLLYSQNSEIFDKPENKDLKVAAMLAGKGFEEKGLV